MKLGKRSTTIHVPPWSFAEEYPSPKDNGRFNGAIDDYSLHFLNDSLKALQRYLPSNDAVSEFNFPDGSDAVDAHTCDHFRMFEFKVRMCSRGRSHDWTECPFAHPGEKARRRDPRKFHYSGTACPDFRKGYCRKGDSCEFAHGVFECWLHPARYRTQPCKDGMSCTRRVCFFAHAPEQLRVLSPRALMSSPETVSPATDSPPVSPMSGNLVDETASFLRRLQLNKVMSMPNSSSWMSGPGGSLSPRVNMNRTGFLSLPSTPTQEVTRHELGYFDTWDNNQEDPVVDRVESGRNLRAKMFEKLSRENPLDRVDPDPDPDLGWVSDLVQ